MKEAPTVKGVVEEVVAGKTTEREKAVALHDYVREGVKFGFSPHFDAAEPDYTLACGVGCCNSKSRLLVELFRAAGLESYQHFVAIPKKILKGAIPVGQYWMIPAVVSHSYVEVRVDGTWCAIDSFIVDTPLLEAAQSRLAAEGQPLGYGTRVDSTNLWDGKGDAFSQYDASLLIEDHGRVQDLERYFQGKQYRNQVLGLRFNTLFKAMGEMGVAGINAKIEAVRRQSAATGSERAPVLPSDTR
jgi:hypothetical protein